MFVDLCNVKAGWHIKGFIDEAIYIVRRKVQLFIEEGGFNVEIVVDSNRDSQGLPVQKEGGGRNIIKVFTCIEESGMQTTADDYIISEVSKNCNKKNRKYDEIVVVTDDLGLHDTLIYLVGPKSNFIFELWGVLEFLDKNSLV